MNSIEIIERFRPALGGLGHLCVAGGAVRDELLGRVPKDYDLFVLRPGPWDFNTSREAISEHLHTAGFEPADPELEWHQSEPFLIQNVLVDGLRVQVMANPAKDLDALVATFDWNVSLFGAEPGRTVALVEIASIGYGKELRLNKVTYPLSTLRRGFRFSERFKMLLRREDVVVLSRKIVESADQAKVREAIHNEDTAF